MTAVTTAHADEAAVTNTAQELHVARACWLNNTDNNSNINANNRNVNNHNALRGIARHAEVLFMSSRDLWLELCSYNNLFLAYKKARKHKTTRDCVLHFEMNLKQGLLQLRSDLLFHSYNPKPLITFIIRDPKTRKISKSDFRDRIVHHALVNILEPIYERIFIHDSFANRKGKGTLAAIKRFDHFKRKVSKNNSRSCYVLKADIRKYFENVDHSILLRTIRQKIADPRILLLIKKIVAHGSAEGGGGGGGASKGMPLGNLTSQFFANIYLNRLDQFVKHQLKAKYYIRYVDDFLILDTQKALLESYKESINTFLLQKLRLQLHPLKTKVIQLGNALTFLGFREFYHHKLLKKSNQRKMSYRLEELTDEYHSQTASYDDLYDFLEGWIAYAKNANSSRLRKKITREFEQHFPSEISSKEVNRCPQRLKLP